MSTKTNEILNKTLNFIKNYTLKNNYPPTVREIQSHLNVQSTSTVSYYLQKLEEKGFIKKSGNKNRCITILDNDTSLSPSNLKKIPLLGEVAAGKPIFAFENYDEVYEFSNNLFSNNNDLFMLTVKGDSMIDVGIFDKDKIIVKKQNYANNSDIVVAMINGYATVKRFFKEKTYIRLQPENSSMKPIYCFSCDILGKVIGLIRNY